MVTSDAPMTTGALFIVRHLLRSSLWRFLGALPLLSHFSISSCSPTAGRGSRDPDKGINEIGVASQNFFYKCLR
jgi:hypothetical protein